MMARPLQAWYMCDDVADQKAPNQREPPQPVTPAELAALGVQHWHFSPDEWNYPVKAFPYEPAVDQRDPKLQKLRDEWGMNYADIITITKEHLPDFENKLKFFFEEHIHSDDEIRYILDGSGYFDVRDQADRWIRIHCQKGDLISLPEGIYHRFTLDSTEYAKAMRLFIGDPVWTPLNRPQDEHASRAKYRARFLAAAEPAEPSAKRRRQSDEARAVVLDVEGTTTPISFVKDTLFGFFTREVGAWLERQGGSPAGLKALEAIRAQLKEDGEDEARDPVEVLKEWVAKDRKVSALKGLQGLLWQDGYDSGALKGAMFEDVPAALQAWDAAGKKIYIFSSGSRQAQRLIFACSDKGDLSRHLSGYFEPVSVGGHSKQAEEAYRQIALTLGLPPATILFATDIPGEAQAAQAAGWSTVLLVRPGNAPLPAGLPFQTATSLLEI